MTINFEQDRVESVTQIDAAKSLSDKVLKLKDLEDEILNAEESINKLKEQARILSQVEIPAMMQEMHITKLKLKDGESVEVKPFYSASIVPEVQEQAFECEIESKTNERLKLGSENVVWQPKKKKMNDEQIILILNRKGSEFVGLFSNKQDLRTFKSTLANMPDELKNALKPLYNKLS